MNKINIINDIMVALKTGYANQNKFTYCKVNKFCLTVLWVLYKENLISDFKVKPLLKKVEIRLKYIKTKPLLTDIKIISKPQLQTSVNFNELQTFYNKFDYFFLSTTNGIVSSKIILRNLKLGGKILFGLKINN